MYVSIDVSSGPLFNWNSIHKMPGVANECE